MPHSCSCRGTQCTLHPQFGFHTFLRCMVWEYAVCSTIVHINAPLAAARHNPSKLGFCSRLAQTFVFNRRLAAARHSPSELGLCARLAQTFLFFQNSGETMRAFDSRRRWRRGRQSQASRTISRQCSMSVSKTRRTAADMERS